MNNIGNIQTEKWHAGLFYGKTQQKIPDSAVIPPPPPDLISNVIHQISYVRHTYSKAMCKAEDNYTSECTSTQQFTACH